MLDPAKFSLSERPFHTEGEYLESLFVVLDLLLFRDADSRMKERGLSAGQDAEDWMRLIRDRLEMTEAAGGRLSTERILEKLEAPDYLRYLLAFLVKCSLDPVYESLAAAERGRNSLTLYDFCEMFAVPAKKEDPAAIYGMLERSRKPLKLLFPQLFAREQNTGHSIAALLPVMDARLLSVLLGRGEADPLLAGMETYLPESVEPENGDIRKSAFILLRRRESMPPELAVLWGPEGSGKREVIKAYADLAGQSIVFYEIPKPERAEDGRAGSGLTDRVRTELLLLFRECILFDRQPVITRAERLQKEEQQELAAFLLKKEQQDPAEAIFLLIEAEEAPDYLDGCYFLPMEELRTTERIRLWKKALPENADISREGIDALANTFVLTRGQIREAAAQAARLAGPDSPVTEDLLYRVCYAKLGHPLKNHTQRVKSSFVWDDLKMNAPDKAILRDLVSCVRNRHIVMQEWNFERKVPYGAGITALLSGPPGTGKTMAAQIIANELHMELYKIDLSQLIDKYVGETEKNIKRVFAEAGRSNSVLFFDEADAIFNKRLEAGNSNDRFANIESSLLLQCIEEYSGVTLLATNNMTAIDAAFLRRFRFYVQFKEPDEEIRFEIWSSVFPKEAPVDREVDYRELAKTFQFTGAIIKNVALQAAYLSAEAGKSIGLLEIMVAIKRELEKNHRMLTRDEMGSFGYLFPKVIAWNIGK